MKIENIRLFLDVVRYGSINKAAEKNFIAQQNLSVTIKNMEKELGHTLLERTNAGITLTENGHNFLPMRQKNHRFLRRILKYFRPHLRKQHYSHLFHLGAKQMSRRFIRTYD